MSAFTKPLAQARDNVRHIVEGPGAVLPGQNLRHVDDCPGCAILAALDRVERLATDMETALLAIENDAKLARSLAVNDSVLAKLLDGIIDGSRAVLSAREEGTA